MSDDRYIEIVFDGPPSNESGRFVEVEDPNHASVNIGTWIDRGTGIWALRITPADCEKALYKTPTAEGWYLDKNDEAIYVTGNIYKRPGYPAIPAFHFRDVAPFRRLVVAEDAS